MPSPFDATIAGLLKREGGYVDNPADRGGATNFGISQSVARANGYAGPMQDLPRNTALEIYRNIYWLTPRFDLVAKVSSAIAGELFDTAVNMGPSVAVTFLNRSLNALVDGEFQLSWKASSVGDQSLDLLTRFIKKRGVQGEHVLLKALNCLQGQRYLELAELKPSNKTFVYGWLANRVDLSLT